MTSPANSDFWESALSEAKKVNNGISAKKEASQVRDWGGEGRGGAPPFPSSHSLIKLHLLIDQFRIIKIHTWFRGWGE